MSLTLPMLVSAALRRASALAIMAVFALLPTLRALRASELSIASGSIVPGEDDSCQVRAQVRA